MLPSSLKPPFYGLFNTFIFINLIIPYSYFQFWKSSDRKEPESNSSPPKTPGIFLFEPLFPVWYNHFVSLKRKQDVIFR